MTNLPNHANGFTISNASSENFLNNPFSNFILIFLSIILRRNLHILFKTV